MSSVEPRQRVGIVGLGLMGGSVARSLRALEHPPRVTAFSNDPDDVRAALDAGIIDVKAETSEDAVADQDVLIYATPLGATLDLMRAHSALWGDAAVTDLVGLKEPILALAREQGFSDVYVGAHPMAGGTGSGFACSADDLFVDRTVWIVLADAEEQRSECVETLWRSLGARIKRIGASDHDRLMAWASHVPQLMATALARVLAARGLEVGDLGPGGLDMTRLAISASETWRDLLDVSADRDAAGLEALEQELAALRATLSAGDLDAVGAMMDQARTWREGG